VIASIRAQAFLRNPSQTLRQQLGELVKQINLALEKTELDSATLKSNLITAISSKDLSNLAGAKTAVTNAQSSTGKATATVSKRTEPTQAQELLAEKIRKSGASVEEQNLHTA